MEGQPTGFEIAFVYTIYKVNSQGGSKHMTTVVRLSKTFLQNDIEVCNGTMLFSFFEILCPFWHLRPLA